MTVLGGQVQQLHPVAGFQIHLLHGPSCLAAAPGSAPTGMLIPASSALRPCSRLPRGYFWPPSPRPSLDALSTAPRRCRNRRPYSLLLGSASSDGRDTYDPPGDETSGGDEEEDARDAGGDVGAAATAGGATAPSEKGDVTMPRVDEQLAVGSGDGGGSGESGVDWDAAWASTRQTMEKQRREAAPFSGRKEVVATKNSNGGYDFVEISADGSRQRRGNGGGGFGFADDGAGDLDSMGQIRDQEQRAVDFATTNKAFAALFAVLAASLIFEVYVYLSGGITNGATRFQGVGQPTVYDALPLPPTPGPEDDLTV